MNRVVTGYDENGDPAIIWQGEPPTVIHAGRYTTTELWVSDRCPLTAAEPMPRLANGRWSRRRAVPAFGLSRSRPPPAATTAPTRAAPAMSRALAPQEGQQIGVELIRMGVRESVRRARIVDFLCAPDELG
jgi:hypothetical protein